MKLPIPDDWDGQTFECIQIEWPSSTLYRGILLGLLSQMSAGRLWDESTGSIIDQQTAMREIWARNYPLTACNGQECPDCDDNGAESINRMCQAVSGLFEECEEYTMPCLDLPGMFEQRGNELWAKNSCCEWERIYVGSGADSPEDIGDTPLEIPGEDPPTYSACGKAEAAARIIRDVFYAVWEQRDSYPWQWIGRVESDLGLDLNNAAIVLCVNQCVIMAAAGYTLNQVFPESTQTWLKCQLLNKFSDNADTATEDDFLSAKALLKGHFGYDPFKLNLADFVFQALGWKHFRDAIKLGATQTGDCVDCEEVINPGTPGDVYFTGALQVTSKPTEIDTPTLTLNGARSLATLNLSGNDDMDYTSLEFRIGITSLNPLTSLTLRYRGGCPTVSWHTPAEPDLTDIRPGQLDGVSNESWSIVGGSVGAGYLDIQFTWAGASFPTFLTWDTTHAWRVNPRDIAAPWVKQATIEVIAYS